MASLHWFEMRDVVELVADRLCTTDLRALSLTASAFRKPTAKRLFHCFTMQLPADGPKFLEAIELLSVRGLGRYVRELTFCTPEPPPARCTLACVAQTVQYTPSLLVLDFIAIRWCSVFTRSEFQVLGEVSGRPFLCLNCLYLGYLDIFSSSPLEVFELIQSCNMVRITGCRLDRVLHSWPPFPHRAKCSSFIAECPPSPAPSLIHPVSNPVPFGWLSTVQVSDINLAVLRSLVAVITDGSLHTLSSLHLHFMDISPHAEGHLQTLLLVLQKCSVLEELHVSIPINTSLENVPPSHRYNLRFFETMAIALPRVLRNFYVCFKITRGSSCDLAAYAIRGIDWKRVAVGWEENESTTLSTVHFTLKTHTGYDLRWTAYWRSLLLRSFKKFRPIPQHNDMLFVLQKH